MVQGGCLSPLIVSVSQVRRQEWTKHMHKTMEMMGATWNLLFTLYASDFVILVRDIFTLNKIRVILARKKRK